jgi:hypothetical protein
VQPSGEEGAEMTRKLVLCRPAGGLNDMLCQIGKAIRYGQRYERSIIIDTYFHFEMFRDFMSYYFKSNLDSVILPEESAPLELNCHDVFPHFLQGRLNAYSVSWDPTAGSFVENSTGKPISFDFEKDYAETLLVHHDAGGGLDSLHALSCLTLQKHIRKSLLARLGIIGGAYDGIHIRNSDYKTNYKEVIASIKGDIRSPVFVATDSSEVLSYCNDVLGKQNVYSFSRFFSTIQVPLHYQLMDLKDTRLRNIDAILDLLTLALARKLYVFPIQSDSPNPVYSGFSLLAEALSRNPQLLYSLTGISRPWRGRWFPLQWFCRSD